MTTLPKTHDAVQRFVLWPPLISLPIVLRSFCIKMMTPSCNVTYFPMCDMCKEILSKWCIASAWMTFNLTIDEQCRLCQLITWFLNSNASMITVCARRNDWNDFWNFVLISRNFDWDFMSSLKWSSNDVHIHEMHKRSDTFQRSWPTLDKPTLQF